MDTTLNTVRYDIFFDSRANVSYTEFLGDAYYYDHSEGSWHFTSQDGRELIAQGSEVVYFTTTPVSVLPAAPASE